MKYQWNGENTITDVVSALAAMLAGYATAAMAKNGKAKTAMVVNGALGVGGLIAKGYTNNPMYHEALEGLAYGGFAGLGTWAACNTTTWGNKGQMDLPVWKYQAPAAAAAVRYIPPVPKAMASVPISSGGQPRHGVSALEI